MLKVGIHWEEKFLTMSSYLLKHIPKNRPTVITLSIPSLFISTNKKHWIWTALSKKKKKSLSKITLGYRFFFFAAPRTHMHTTMHSNRISQTVWVYRILYWCLCGIRKCIHLHANLYRKWAQYTCKSWPRTHLFLNRMISHIALLSIMISVQSITLIHAQWRALNTNRTDFL